MTAADALAALARDATTPDLVADRLAEAGCRGVPGDCNACPVANWLALKTGEAWWVERGSAQWLLAPWPRVRLPRVVNRFIGRFDRGRYPHLRMAEAAA